MELYEGEGFAGTSLGLVPFTLTDGLRGCFDVDFSFVNLTVGERYSAQVVDLTPKWRFSRNQYRFPDGNPLLGRVG